MEKKFKSEKIGFVDGQKLFVEKHGGLERIGKQIEGRRFFSTSGKFINCENVFIIH